MANSNYLEASTEELIVLIINHGFCRKFWKSPQGRSTGRVHKAPMPANLVDSCDGSKESKKNCVTSHFVKLLLNNEFYRYSGN